MPATGLDKLDQRLAAGWTERGTVPGFRDRCGVAEKGSVPVFVQAWSARGSVQAPPLSWTVVKPVGVHSAITQRTAKYTCQV